MLCDINGMYKGDKVVRKETEELPNMFRPLMLHWDGKTNTYNHFFLYQRVILDLDVKQN